MKKSYVYKITCLVTGEYYFGSSFNANSDRYWGGGRKVRERISQYGNENFVKEILGEYNDRVEAHKVENQYIKKFINDEKCLNKQLDHKFGTYGEESCAKRSAALRGKIVSDETRVKMSAAQRGEKNHNFGKHLSEEVKAKISAANAINKRGEKNPMFGKHFSEEHKAKISAAIRGKHWRKNTITGKREWYD